MAYVWPKFENCRCLLMFVLGSYLKGKNILKTGNYNRIFRGKTFKETFCIKCEGLHKSQIFSNGSEFVAWTPGWFRKVVLFVE